MLLKDRLLIMRLTNHITSVGNTTQQLNADLSKQHDEANCKKGHIAKACQSSQAGMTPQRGRDSSCKQNHTREQFRILYCVASLNLPVVATCK